MPDVTRKSSIVLIFVTYVQSMRWPDPRNDTLIFIANPIEAGMPGHWVPGSIVKAILSGSSPFTEKILPKPIWTKSRRPHVTPKKHIEHTKMPLLHKGSTQIQITTVKYTTIFLTSSESVQDEDHTDSPPITSMNKITEPSEISTEASEEPTASTKESTEPTEKSTDPPIESTKLPEESSELPLETTEPPSESTELPAESTEAPEHSTTQPEESTEHPTESTEPLEESTEPPEESTETPEESHDASEESTTTTKKARPKKKKAEQPLNSNA